MTSKDISDRVRLRDLKTLSNNHYTLRRAEFDFRRSDGTWQAQSRESYDIGDAAAVLPLDRARGKVLLIRQFRWPAFESGSRELLVEAIAGKLDGDDPQACAIREAIEEAGVTISNLRLVSHCFISPGAVKERLSLFLADYDSAAPRGKGGGHEQEGEDVEVLEMPLDDAFAMIASGDIIDIKTIALLQAAKLAA
jgi:nudix-type nucleoside diphosphatase (YffH/AdpP family)